MLTAPLLQNAIQNLRYSIRGRALSSLQMRQEANQLTGLNKHKMHLRMRRYGQDTRYELLAYALLRGKSYHAVEPACHIHNKPVAFLLQKSLIRSVQHEDNLAKSLWPLPQLEEWMAPKSAAAEAAA